MTVVTIEPGCVLGLLAPMGGEDHVPAPGPGLHRSTAGGVKVFGQADGRELRDAAAANRLHPHEPAVSQGYDAITYLDYMARLCGLPANARKPRLASLIRAVDLLGESGNPISQFSIGMTARLAVAASLLNEPDLLIWDERPTAWTSKPAAACWNSSRRWPARRR